MAGTAASGHDSHQRERPEGKPEGKTFLDPIDWDSVARWIEDRQGKSNLYFTVNRARPVDKKPLKTDILELVALHVDIGAPEGAAVDEFCDKISAGLAALELEPSTIVKSGGGVQAFWQLQPSDCMAVDGDEQKTEQAERYTRRLESDIAQKLGVTVDACFNCDRIMRLPGTLNVPDQKKIQKGRKLALASVVHTSDVRFPLAAFQQARPKECLPAEVNGAANAPVIKIDWEAARTMYGMFPPEELRKRKVEEHAVLSLEHGDNLDRLHEHHTAIGHRVSEGPYKSFSLITLAVATALLKAGLEPEEAATVLGDNTLPGNKHVTRQKDSARSIELSSAH